MGWNKKGVPEEVTLPYFSFLAREGMCLVGRGGEWLQGSGCRRLPGEGELPQSRGGIIIYEKAKPLHISV